MPCDWPGFVDTWDAVLLESRIAFLLCVRLYRRVQRVFLFDVCLNGDSSTINMFSAYWAKFLQQCLLKRFLTNCAATEGLRLFWKHIVKHGAVYWYTFEGLWDDLICITIETTGVREYGSRRAIQWLLSRRYK